MNKQQLKLDADSFAQLLKELQESRQQVTDVYYNQTLSSWWITYAGGEFDSFAEVFSHLTGLTPTSEPS